MVVKTKFYRTKYCSNTFGTFYVIVILMHKDFYASGFLYHPSSQQILLQQYDYSSTTSNPWFFFGSSYLEEEKPDVSFKNNIFTLLDIKVPVVHNIYSYFSEATDKNHYIGYATVRSRQKFSPKNGLTFAWFSFKEVLKIQATNQTKHDIVVGQRVIEAATRKRLGEHTSVYL
jgi:hypothetical protein